MPHAPPTIATLPLTSPTPLQCHQCRDIDRLAITLGVAMAIPVVHVTCPIHGVLAQFPLALHALAYYVPEVTHGVAT